MIKLNSLSRKNPQDRSLPERFYVQAVADGFVDLEELAYQVSNQCTVREADCLAVLSALQHNVINALAKGRIVQLGGIGNFQVGVRSTASDLEDEVSASNVRSSHINFRPGKRLRNMLKTLEYKVSNG